MMFPSRPPLTGRTVSAPGNQGGIPGFNTIMARCPGHGTCAMVLSNLATPEIGKIAADLAHLVFGDPLSTPLEQ